MEIFYHNLGLKRLRCPFFCIKKINIYTFYFIWCFAVFKFDELVPPVEDIEEIIECFLTLSELEMSSKVGEFNDQEISSTAVSMLKRKDPSYIFLFYEWSWIHNVL